MNSVARHRSLAFPDETGVLSVPCGQVNRRAGETAIFEAGDGDTLALRWPADAR